MKESISALMDGELDRHSAGELMDTFGRSREALEAWRDYHLISDAMRDTPVLSEDFAARVGARLQSEPTVLAPRRLAAPPRKWFAASAIAASIAAVAFVGWVAVMPQPAPVQVAKAPPAPAPHPALAAAKPPMVPLPSATNDYLLAHQGFSPRIYLQGMAPYVLTVSDSSQEAAKKR